VFRCGRLRGDRLYTMHGRRLRRGDTMMLRCGPMTIIAVHRGSQRAGDASGEERESNILMPFNHMTSEGFWQLVPTSGKEFDRGLMAVEDYRLRISPVAKSEDTTAPAVLELDDRPIYLPNDQVLWPAKSALRWHMEISSRKKCYHVCFDPSSARFLGAWRGRGRCRRDALPSGV
jgi:hypothetical protein